MQSSSIPTRFPIAFAASAGAGYIRTIPQASQVTITNGAASLTDGFPPSCFTSIAAGGSWPFGQDMNGILNQITAWLRWVNGGGPIGYDVSFSTTIGGYPKGAVLMAATNTKFWLSTVENNTTNPDTGGAGWINPHVNSFNTRTGAVTLTSGDVTGALGFAPVQSFNGRTGVVVLIGTDVTGALGYTPVQQGTGTGQLSANVVKIGWSASSRLKATVDATDLGNFATEGASNTFTGTNSFTQTLSTAAISASGAVNATGNVVANSGRLRATFGARASGDTNAAAILADWSLTNFGGFHSWSIEPSGLIEQVWGTNVNQINGTVATTVTIPNAFPTACMDATLCFGGTSPPIGVAICVSPSSASQVIVTTAGPGVASPFVLIRARGY